MNFKTFAAIDIGSFELTMKIFEFSEKNQIKEIDMVKQSLDLGSDTYVDGKISIGKMDELCRALKEFAAIMKTYKVDAYKAYGTSAIRETENTFIILDQIKQRTGIQISILSNSEQRFLDYKSIASKGEALQKIIEQKTAIVNIGGGSIQISLFDNDTLVSTQNLKLGVLRIQELLHHLNPRSTQLEGLIDEAVTAQLAAYKKLYLKDREIQNIILVDDYLSLWAIKRAGDSAQALLTTDDYHTFMELLGKHTDSQIAAILNISEEKVPLMFISAVILKRIADLMRANNIWAPGVTLCDGIAYEYGERKKWLTGEHDFEKDIIACATNISKRYMGSRKRAETLEHLALTVFTGMKKVHGLGKRESLYLRIAALLHDCGKYISMVNIGESSYNIIMATEIIGLSHMEREMIANIVRFTHSEFVYYGQQKANNSSLNKNTYLIVAKLTAILRITNSLNSSHKNKVKGLKAVLKNKQLILTVGTEEDITLERGYFDISSSFFQEVFSIKPVIKQKKQF